MVYNCNTYNIHANKGNQVPKKKKGERFEQINAGEV